MTATAPHSPTHIQHAHSHSAPYWSLKGIQGKHPTKAETLTETIKHLDEKKKRGKEVIWLLWLYCLHLAFCKNQTRLLSRFHFKVLKLTLHLICDVCHLIIIVCIPLSSF